MDSYYDIDAILTDAQKVPCTFELSVPGLGYLDGNAGGQLKQGSRVDLPLWLAKMLAIGQFIGTTKLVKLDLPPALAPRVLNALKADPRTVDLRALAPHFYSLVIRYFETAEEEEADLEDQIVNILSETFKKRAAEIADHAHNPRGALGDGAEFLRGLDEEERKLFRAAHDNSKAVRVWISELKRG